MFCRHFSFILLVRLFIIFIQIFIAEYKGVLYHFIKFKSLAPDAVKKCESIYDEAKHGQTIYLDKYNSK